LALRKPTPSVSKPSFALYVSFSPIAQGYDGGVVTEAPGMYAIGLNLLRRRKSSFIHGAEDDVRELAAHLSAHLERKARNTPAPSSHRTHLSVTR
jgi:hypothetical protein